MYEIIGLKTARFCPAITKNSTPGSVFENKRRLRWERRKAPCFLIFSFFFKLDMRGRPDFTVNEAQRATA